VKALYREGGVRSIYRGTGATLARDGPGSAVFVPSIVDLFSNAKILHRYFVAYEVIKKALTPAGSSPGDLNLGAVVFAGGTAGVAMWALAIPPDVY
jgi:solute carrier family 25 carnitine/acylcarnitine transporter 20/29